MAGPSYKVDPATGDAWWVTQDGTWVTSSVEEATFGGMTWSSSGRLRDISTGQIFSLGLREYADIVQLPSNRLSLTTYVGNAQANAPQSADHRRLISLEETLIDTSGGQHHITIEASSITKAGHQLMVHYRDDGTAEFQEVFGRFPTNQTVADILGSDWRLATADEAIRYAISRYLGKYDEATIFDVTENGIEGSGKKPQNTSEATLLLAEYLSLNVTVQSHLLLEVTQ